MHPLVGIQGTFLREPLKTDNTLERSLPCMGSHVNLKQREKREKSRQHFDSSEGKIKNRHQEKKLEREVGLLFFCVCEQNVDFSFRFFPL